MKSCEGFFNIAKFILSKLRSANPMTPELQIYDYSSFYFGDTMWVKYIWSFIRVDLWWTLNSILLLSFICKISMNTQRLLPFPLYWWYITCHHHCHVPLLAWICLSLSLTILSYHLSPLAGPLDYVLSPCRAFIEKFLLVSQHLHVCVKGSMENVTYEFVLLFQQCPASLVHLIWMVLEMGGRWP